MENYEEVIRLALARFCGYKFGDVTLDCGNGDTLTYCNIWIPPDYREGDYLPLSGFDPLCNAADAWALQKRLIEKDYDVTLFSLPENVYSADTGTLDPKNIRYKCLVLSLSGAVFRVIADTPEAALILAAYEVVKQTQEDAPAG